MPRPDYRSGAVAAAGSPPGQATAIGDFTSLTRRIVKPRSSSFERPTGRARCNVCRGRLRSAGSQVDKPPVPPVDRSHRRAADAWPAQVAQRLRVRVAPRARRPWRMIRAPRAGQGVRHPGRRRGRHRGADRANQEAGGLTRPPLYGRSPGRSAWSVTCQTATGDRPGRDAWRVQTGPRGPWGWEMRGTTSDGPRCSSNPTKLELTDVDGAGRCAGGSSVARQWAR